MLYTQCRLSHKQHHTQSLRVTDSVCVVVFLSQGLPLSLLSLSLSLSLSLVLWTLALSIYISLLHRPNP
jgi:hypothetical protein